MIDNYNSRKILTCTLLPVIGLCLFFLIACTSVKKITHDNQLGYLADEIAKSISAEGKSTIAVSDFPDIEGNIRQYSVYLSEELITRLFRTKKFKVIERNKIDQILKEQAMSSSDLFDNSNVKQIGKLLGVDAIVTGSLTRTGEYIKINARIISVETAEVLAVASVNINYDAVVQELWENIGEYKVNNQKEQQTLIKDPQLEQVIREVIKKPEGALTENDLLNVIVIEAPDRKIEDLGGIEYCVNLRVLKLTNYFWSDNDTTNNNRIKDISAVSRLPLLEVLFLGDCEINNDPQVIAGALDNMDSLLYLDLSRNNLGDVNFLARYTHLSSLLISDNPRIKGINFLKDYTNLKELAIGPIRLNAQDLAILAEFKDLHYLHLHGSGLKDSSFLENMIHLKRLVISDNKFTDISVLLKIHEQGGLQAASEVLIAWNNLDLRPGTTNRNVVDKLANAGVHFPNFLDGNRGE